MLTFARWILFSALFFSQICFADDIQLFNQNHQRIEGYPAIIRTLKSGDVIRFSNGREFTVDGVLGSGGTTMVLALKGDPTKALRLPLNTVDMGFLNQYVEASDYLQKHGISSVHVDESLDSEYVVVDRVNNFMTFAEFVKAATQIESPGILSQIGLGKKKNLPVEEMKKNFMSFAKSLAFSFVGDMHDNNLVYDFQNEKWILIDWTEAHSTQSQIAGTTYYEPGSPLAKLLAIYGATHNLQFTAKSRQYSWLQDMVERAHAQIRAARANGFIDLRCSAIHLP